MAKNQNNRGGNRRSNNNNPEGRNQYSGSLMGMARERPAAAAAVAAGTVAAGVFLWSKRGQISDQISQLSDQIGEWTENMGSNGDRELEMVGSDTETTRGNPSGTIRRSRATPGRTRRSTSSGRTMSEGNGAIPSA